MKITINRGAYEIILDGSAKIVADEYRTLLELIPELASVSREQGKTKTTSAPVNADLDTIWSWVKDNPGHSTYWVSSKNKHGFSVPKALKELARLKKISQHETLYTSTKTAKIKTTDGWYTVGQEPTPITMLDAQTKVVGWIENNSGRTVKDVELYCGVTRTMAEKAVTALLASGGIELYPSESDSSIHYVRLLG